MAKQTVATARMPFIRSAHAEVGDGTCGLCDVVWPCDAGTVLIALARAEQALAEERKWKAWAETVEGLLVHRQTVHDIDLQCEDCQTIIAIFESMEPLAAATSRRAGRGVSDGQ